MLSSGTKCYHLELMLLSGTKCYHLRWNVIIWDAMLSSKANVIIWDKMLSSGANFMIESSGANVIIWCYHVMLSSAMITHPFFIFPENFYSLDSNGVFSDVLSRSISLPEGYWTEFFKIGQYLHRNNLKRCILLSSIIIYMYILQLVCTTRGQSTSSELNRLE